MNAAVGAEAGRVSGFLAASGPHWHTLSHGLSSPSLVPVLGPTITNLHSVLSYLDDVYFHTAVGL